MVILLLLLTQVGISFDQAIIEKLVGKNSDEAFNAAKRVYSEGGNSKSVAHLEIPGGLNHRVPKGTVIHGMGLQEVDFSSEHLHLSVVVLVVIQTHIAIPRNPFSSLRPLS
jgi:hypothetical protein